MPITRKLGFSVRVIAFLFYLVFVASIFTATTWESAFAEIKDPGADGAEKYQATEKADGGSSRIFAEVAQMRCGVFTACAELLPCLLPKFACAFGKGVAAGMGEQRCDIAPELGNIVSDTANQVFHLAVFCKVQ